MGKRSTTKSRGTSAAAVASWARHYPDDAALERLEEAGPVFAHEYPEEAARCLYELQGPATELGPTATGVDFVETLASSRSVEWLDLEAWLDAIGPKWTYSILHWYNFTLLGEDALCESLPAVFFLDFSFFIRQRWISDLLGEWYRHGESEKIAKLLFGSDRTRTRSFKRLMQNRRRDFVLCGEVSRRLSHGRSYRKACEEVSADAPRLVGEKLSWGGVRKMFETRKSGYDPLLKRLFPE